MRHTFTLTRTNLTALATAVIFALVFALDALGVPFADRLLTEDGGGLSPSVLAIIATVAGLVAGNLSRDDEPPSPSGPTIAASIVFAALMVACGGGPQLEAPTNQIDAVELHGGYCIEGSAVWTPQTGWTGDFASTGQGLTSVQTGTCWYGMCSSSSVIFEVGHDGADNEASVCLHVFDVLFEPLCFAVGTGTGDGGDTPSD